MIRDNSPVNVNGRPEYFTLARSQSDVQFTDYFIMEKQPEPLY